MQQIINIPSDKEVYFVSDLHCGHDRSWLYGPRGFNTIQDHDNFHFSQLEEIKGENSVLINLGDATLMDAKREKFDRLASIPFYKHYHIWGNHPSGAKQAYNMSLEEKMGREFRGEVYPLEYKHVTFVGHQKSFRYRGQVMFCHHFPQMDWIDLKLNFWCLNGHEHGELSETNGDRLDCGKILDVGVDTALKFWQKPYWTFDQVKEFMDQRPVVSKGHH